jgi:hypothetical protein
VCSARATAIYSVRCEGRLQSFACRERLRPFTESNRNILRSTRATATFVLAARVTVGFCLPGAYSALNGGNCNVLLAAKATAIFCSACCESNFNHCCESNCDLCWPRAPVTSYSPLSAGRLQSFACQERIRPFAGEERYTALSKSDCNFCSLRMQIFSLLQEQPQPSLQEQP